MKSELGNIAIFLVDSNGSFYRPNLIIPNLSALKNLKEYCEEILSKYPDYFKDTSEEDTVRKKE